MREGELRRVEEEFQKRQEEMSRLPDCSDIETNPIVYGMVKVEGWYWTPFLSTV